MTSQTPRALVLDDEPETVELLRTSLGAMPFETVLVERGIDALIAIFEGFRDERPFAVLVLDCALPHVDGFTVAKIVRMIEATKLSTQQQAKIGFFTAFPEDVERSTLLQSVQADAYWRKPEDVNELPFLIASWLKVEVRNTVSSGQ